jgi:hypothetical protein
MICRYEAKLILFIYWTMSAGDTKMFKVRQLTKQQTATLLFANNAHLRYAYIRANMTQTSVFSTPPPLASCHYEQNGQLQMSLHFPPGNCTRWRHTTVTSRQSCKLLSPVPDWLTRIGLVNVSQGWQPSTNSPWNFMLYPKGLPYYVVRPPAP